MKINDLLSQYLYQHKELVLEGFGVFHMDPSVNITDNKDAQHVFQAITFENDTKIKTPESVIAFVVEHSRKMRPLAMSDLEAFLTTGRELLNLGKPLILNGIGTLTLAHNQSLAFTPGPFTPIRLEEKGAEGHFRERVATSEKQLFPPEKTAPSRSGSISRPLLLIAGALFIVLLGWTIYHFTYQRSGSTVAADSSQLIQPIETSDTPMARKDSITSSLKPDTITQQAIQPIQHPATADSNRTPVTPSASAAPATYPAGTFKIVLETSYNKDHALKRFGDLRTWGHKVNLETNKDSAKFVLSMPFRTPLSDTARSRDSLSRFFGRPVRVVVTQ